MNEALENAWKEFERTGEIANSADELLGYATRLTEENAKLRDIIEMVIFEAERNFDNSIDTESLKAELNQIKERSNDK